MTLRYKLNYSLTVTKRFTNMVKNFLLLGCVIEYYTKRKIYKLISVNWHLLTRRGFRFPYQGTLLHCPRSFSPLGLSTRWSAPDRSVSPRSLPVSLDVHLYGVWERGGWKSRERRWRETELSLFSVGRSLRSSMSGVPRWRTLCLILFLPSSYDQGLLPGLPLLGSVVGRSFPSSLPRASFVRVSGCEHLVWGYT